MLNNNRFTNLVGTSLPLIQAPMAGAQDHRLAVAVSKAGGLGSIPCAMLDKEQIVTELTQFRQLSDCPVNLNFFCHTPQATTRKQDIAWKQRMAGYYLEYGIEIDTPLATAARNPFDEHMCQLVEEHKPEVVSFHFGLPESTLLDRVKTAGCIVLCSATTVDEAIWLEKNGCDAIIAQGVEAGGHRGMFLSDDIAAQPGIFALIPQVADAVSVPVIAAGAIADGRAIAAAFILGASAVQIGTAFLLTDESNITQLHRAALLDATESKTALSNIFSGRPARSLYNRVMRECGPIANDATVFPTAGAALAPIKAAAEKNGKADFSSLWSGQAARYCKQGDAQTLAASLMQDAAKMSVN